MYKPVLVTKNTVTGSSSALALVGVLVHDCFSSWQLLAGENRHCIYGWNMVGLRMLLINDMYIRMNNNLSMDM